MEPMYTSMLFEAALHILNWFSYHLTQQNSAKEEELRKK